ncbi:hypothetical protein FW774_03775 (plasmid) [Pedobacter sp. BS3]|uniref:PH domain-containing protein n=1 Tax=Pedobacter sp. BS3 TaxID=2567937 RepID=UPI0011ED3CA3|nr:PH domain-containing protein [Pedobacter sp. BS3]TZF86179.1 hypothetical protein FW774_03775 [Pedobacter sp. BS3]
MNIDRFLTDEQDAKTAEKVLTKVQDMLTSGEDLVYLAVQKKPVANLIPDAIVLTSKRIIFCIPGNLGLTTNFEIFLWKDIKEVAFKEEFFGAKFTAIPLKGENLTIDYIPKVQARKLYQFSNQQLENQREAARQQEMEDKKASVPPVAVNVQPEPVKPPVVEEPEPADEVTQKLQRLKMLYEKQLITGEEYEAKKADILSQL